MNCSIVTDNKYVVVKSFAKDYESSDEEFPIEDKPDANKQYLTNVMADIDNKLGHTIHLLTCSLQAQGCDASNCLGGAQHVTHVQTCMKANCPDCHGLGRNFSKYLQNSGLKDRTFSTELDDATHTPRSTSDHQVVQAETYVSV